MKRSDMIDIIVSWLKENTDTDKKQSTYGIRIDANDLLSGLERAGMLPPPIGIGEEDDWGYLDYKYEWELEDEEE